MHGGTNDLCVEELSAGESSAIRTELPQGPSVGILRVTRDPAEARYGVNRLPSTGQARDYCDWRIEIALTPSLPCF